MADLMLLLLLISFGLFLIGLVNPQISLFWSGQSRTRKKSALTYIILTLAFFICFGINQDALNSGIKLASADTLHQKPPEPDIRDTAVAQHLFNYPGLLVKELSKNGLGEVKPWNNAMDMGWGTLTDYIGFGSVGRTGLQNNLSYYLEGTEKKVQKLTLTLNINNPVEKRKGLGKMAEVSEASFKTIHVNMPTKLKQAIQTGKQYKQQLPLYSIHFYLRKSKIESWLLEITAK